MVMMFNIFEMERAQMFQKIGDDFLLILKSNFIIFLNSFYVRKFVFISLGFHYACL